MRRFWVVGALCALSLSARISAQGEESPPTSREQIEKEIEERQKAMREGRVVRSNVRITLRLKNGSRMKGVVKDGRFVERPAGLEFLLTDMTEEGAGIRLWYYDRTNSFVFLPYSTVAYHKIGDRLTDEEVRKIAAELDRIASDKARTKEDPAAAKPKPDEKDGAAPGVEDADLPTLTDEQKAILAEFPPAEGWSYDRMRELEARKVRIGVFPNEREQKFLDNFGVWTQAAQLQQQIDDIKANRAAQRPPAPGGGTGGIKVPIPIGVPGGPGGLPTPQKGAPKK